jgi:hypothetical protein
VACLPAAVSLLLLEALFIQISGVSLALTWPHRLCLLRVLWANHCYKLSPFQAHRGRWHCTWFLRPVCLFTVHVGGGSSPLSCGVFLPPLLLQAFPLLVAGPVPPPLRPELLQLVYLQFWKAFSPDPSALRAPHPLCLVCLLFLLLIIQSLFSLGGVVCPGRCADLAQGCLRECRVLLSSPCVLRLPKPLGTSVLQRPWGPPGFSV